MAENYVYTKNEDSLVKEGDYEARIELIEKKVLPSGKEKLSVRYRIRTDVEQQYGNKVIFEDIWSERENPQFFNRKRLNQLMGTQNIKDGTVFSGIEDVIEFLTGTNLIIHVAIVFDDYNGKDTNTVSFYRSSKAQPQVIGVTEQPKVAETPAKNTISDLELPF